MTDPTNIRASTDALIAEERLARHNELCAELEALLAQRRAAQ